MDYRKTILVIGVILLGGCTTLSDKSKQANGEFKINSSMKSKSTTTAQIYTPANILESSTEIMQERTKMIEELEQAYKLDVEDKLPYALSYISSAQVEEYETKKKAGFWGGSSRISRDNFKCCI